MGPQPPRTRLETHQRSPQLGHATPPLQLSTPEPPIFVCRAPTAKPGPKQGLYVLEITQDGQGEGGHSLLQDAELFILSKPRSPLP